MISRRRKPRGSAMMIALILIVFVLPIVTVLVKSVFRQSKTNFQERNMKTARVVSNDIMINFMRVHSGNYYEDHYDTRFMLSGDVSNTFLSAGNSGVGTVGYVTGASAVGKYFYVQSTATLVSGADQTVWGKKGMVGVIGFENDLTRFGMIFMNDAIFRSNSFYAGKTLDTSVYAADRLYLCGNSTAGDCAGNVAPGPGMTLTNGPYIAANHLHLGSNNTLAAGTPAYYPWGPGVRKDGMGSYLGPTYAFTPEVSLVAPNLTYYMTRNNFLVSPASPTFNVLEFQTGGANGRVYFPNAGYTFDVPTNFSPQGVPSAVIVSTGMDLTITGDATVRGRFTIVCLGCNVTVLNDLTYHQTPSPLPVAGCGLCATPNDALAVLTDGQIRFESSAADTTPAEQTVAGLFYSSTGQLMKQSPDATWANLKVYGTLVGFMGPDPAPGNATQLSVRQDPNLRYYLPPMLPERPVMVTRANRAWW